MPFKNQIQFRVLKPDLQKDLESRSGGEGFGPSQVASRDLERYYYMLRVSLPKFSEEEAIVLMAVTNGHIVRPETARLLWAEVEDAVSGGVPSPMEMSIEAIRALIDRLKDLTPFECLAIEDALERAWENKFRLDDVRQVLRSVGLVKEEKEEGEGKGGK